MSQQLGVLLIDEDPGVHEVFLGLCSSLNCSLISALSFGEVASVAAQVGEMAGIDVVFSALETTSVAAATQGTARVKAIFPNAPLYFLTKAENLSVAKASLTFGADGYLVKPMNNVELLRVLERLKKCEDVIPMPPPVTETTAAMTFDGLIGRSPEMQKVFKLIRKVAPSDVNVLITGESGTGKEVVASAIHRFSSRKKGQFIAINCAAIPRDLLESELFGHAKGAFTGAVAARRGLFEEADEGTILLDEIGDLPLSLQAKILRLLQTKEVKPLGQNASKEVNVRIISATHKNLKALIQTGEFREDLYYRLNVMPIHLPPLRDRREDIPLLAEHFRRKYTDAVATKVKGFSERAMKKLVNMPWKGNVRELENAIERALVLAEGEQIEDDDIIVEEPEPNPLFQSDVFGSGMTLKEVEKEYIKYILGKTGNKKETATRILGIDRKTLYRKERIYGLRQGGLEIV